ncbi:MAG: lactoylglutathione lyase [Deltaproteobacteria bacterium]|nr:MAG: lactoylglutathione lyase [Deltaproteobacteria bacterium]
MRYLHTMIRVTDLEKSIHFYTQGLGFKLVSRDDYPDDRFTLAFLRSGTDPENGPMIELTHNWDTKSYTKGDAYGHVAYAVDSVDVVQERLKKNGYDLSWGPGLTPSGKTKMAFVDDPDGYEIELLEKKAK